MYSSVSEFRSAVVELPQADADGLARARSRQAILTKPPGSLGRLEDIACFLASWQKNGPLADRIDMLVFAGNHGVTAQGVSPFPAEVTVQMVANFERGGAAINALCRSVGLGLKVIAIDLDRPTADFTLGEAMTEREFLDALNTGANAVERAADLVAVGEMGIGNSTAAAALAAATFGGAAGDWVGRGTGLDDEGVSRKALTVERAIARNSGALNDPLRIMRSFGGRELAAIAGAVIKARQYSIPVILDGYITTAAVAPLSMLNADALNHCLAGHRSNEQAHGRLLDRLGLDPILDLGMRLGEGSGGALAAAIIRGAVATHRQMATFAEAGVSDSA